MLMHEATPELIDVWKSVYGKYRAGLTSNRKSARQMIEYMKSKYFVTEIMDQTYKRAVLENVLNNRCHYEKLPAGIKPKAVVFLVQNEDAGKQLYAKQDELYKGQSIFAGFELETGFFHVEGSSELWDDLFAFRGLDEADLNNFYLVVEYVSCLRKFDMLDEVLAGTEQAGLQQ